MRKEGKLNVWNWLLIILVLVIIISLIVLSFNRVQNVSFSPAVNCTGNETIGWSSGCSKNSSILFLLAPAIIAGIVLIIGLIIFYYIHKATTPDENVMDQSEIEE